MKRLISVLLSIAIIMTFGFPVSFAEEELSFRSMSDPTLLEYLEESVYASAITNLDSEDYVVGEVQAIYISQEYIDELAYNSRLNVYFGFTQEEIDSHFDGTRYVFTLGTDGHTVITAFEPYDDSINYASIIKNVACGTGVILLCVTVTVASLGAGAPAVTMIFAVAADTAITCAKSGAVIGAVTAGITKYNQTGDIEAALRETMVGGSEGYKWGAIAGAVAGAASETVSLYEAGKLGAFIPDNLSMNEIAKIQKEMQLPMKAIEGLNSMREYNVYRKAGLKVNIVGGKLALIRDVDFAYVDKDGLTNAQRIFNGLAPLDPEGNAYELHHIGQVDSLPIAILTKAEHRLGENYIVLHPTATTDQTQIDKEVTKEDQKAFWLSYYLTFGHK